MLMKLERMGQSRYNEGSREAGDLRLPGTERGWLPMHPHLTTCSIVTCDLPSHARGLCHKHYWYWWCHTHSQRRYPRGPKSPILVPDLLGEIWRPVVRWEGYYEVSNFGRVRRVLPGNGTRSGRILTPIRLSNGYVHVSLSRDNQHHAHSVHRLVLGAFRGSDSRPVNHVNGLKADNRLSNLEYVTPSQNTAHAYRTGLLRIYKGRNHYAKLTPEAVRAIRVAPGLHREIAKMYGIGRRTVGDIKAGRRWANLP